MNIYRRSAVAAGLLLITATVAAVISRVAFLAPVLGGADPLAAVAADENRVLVGALLLVLGAFAACGIAIALFPVVRAVDETLAIGSVAFRVIEGAFYLGIVVCVLLMVALGEASAAVPSGQSPALAAAAAVVLAAREALGQVGVLAFGVGGCMYYAAMYRARLVPRWLSGWGLAATVGVVASGVIVIAGVIEPMSTPQIILAMPIGVQEMVLAAWLLVKGFRVPGESMAAQTGVALGAGTPAGTPAVAR